MALVNVPVSIGGVNKSLIAGQDANGNVSPSHTLVNSSGVEIGTSSNPITVITSANPATNIATNQVTIGNTAAVIVPARVGRRSVMIIQEGTTLARLGAANVTMQTGIPLPATQYSTIVIDGSAAIYGIVAASSTTVSYLEIF